MILTVWYLRKEGHGGYEKISRGQGVRFRVEELIERRDAFRVVNIFLNDAIIEVRCHHIFVKTHRKHNPHVDPNANCELRVIMMCQCWFINYHKYITRCGMRIMGVVCG